jgi:hypothetical protein
MLAWFSANTILSLIRKRLPPDDSLCCFRTRTLTPCRTQQTHSNVKRAHSSFFSSDFVSEGPDELDTFFLDVLGPFPTTIVPAACEELGASTGEPASMSVKTCLHAGSSRS